MKAEEIMTPNPFCLYQTDSIQYAAIQFHKQGIGGAPVVDNGGKLAGIFAKEHLMLALAEGLPNSLLVGELMDTEVITVARDTDINEMWHSKAGRFPVVDEEGGLIGIITRTDLAKAFLQEKEAGYQKFQAIMYSLYNGILAVDKHGFITVFNPAAEKISGIPAQEASGKYVTEIFPNTGLLEILCTGEYKFGQRMLFGQREVISNRAPILENGEIIGAIAVVQDISDLESISAELKASKELNAELDAIIDSIYDGIYITDGQGITTRINKSYTRITGIKPQEVIGRNVQELVDIGWYTQVVTPLVLKNRRPETIMHTIRGKKQCLITGNPIINERGEITSVVTIVRDISDLIKLKEKLEHSEELTRQYHIELELLRQKQVSKTAIVGQSVLLKQIFELALRAAQVDATVLIWGETGVGKGVIAREIHKNSPRSKGPYVEINCAAIPENLLESELFGYEKGAFTGALVKGKPGMFELADKGTVLLDEIGEMPMSLQVKLLHVIQEKEVTRIGGVQSKELDVRIIAATNQNLDDLVKEGQFREDLYYRLNVIPIYIPPLRSRREDIPLLVYHFLDVFNKKYQMRKQIEKQAVEMLLDYSWPGNIRELENFVERILIMINEQTITCNHIKGLLNKGNTEVMPQEFGNQISLDEATTLVEKQLIARALSVYGSTRKAAKILRVSQPTIVRKAKKYGINFTT